MCNNSKAKYCLAVIEENGYHIVKTCYSWKYLWWYLLNNNLVSSDAVEESEARYIRFKGHECDSLHIGCFAIIECATDEKPQKKNIWQWTRTTGATVVAE